MLTRLALIGATLWLVFAANAADPNATSAKSKQLIEVLQSNAALFEKARACQQLGEFGSPDAVPALASLLTDRKLSAYARSGLEGIPDPSAAAALRQAALTVKGPLLSGVINSLGTLRDAAAVDLLARLAADSGSGVVKEALLALGNIATPAAVRVLQETLSSGPATVRDDAAAGCLLAADRQRSSGQLEQAVELYDSLRKPQVALAIRVGATRGAILARDSDRVPFLIEQLRAEERAIRNAALLTIRDIPGNALSTALNAELARATPELQQTLLPALADCHNAQSVDAVRPLADSPVPEVRKGALSVLGRLGPDAAPVLLGALEKDHPVEERAIVINGLKGLKGSSVDDVLRHGLTAASTPSLRVDLIRVLDSRGAAAAIPELMQQAAGPEKEPQLAALACLRTLAGAEQAPALITLAKSSSDGEVQESAENALAGICDRSGERACATVLTELTRATQSSERKSWIRVLARGGCTQALPALEAAANDTDPAVSAAALAELGRWPNPAPMGTLLKALGSGSNLALQRRALASVIDLSSTAADEAQAPAPAIVSWLQQASRFAQSTEDKLRVLGVLGRLKTVESFRLLASYLDDPGVRNEAALGIIQIAPALTTTEESGAVKQALQKIASTSDNDLRNRAVQAARSIPVANPAVSLFDGHSLAGWEGVTSVWRVQDGVIVGGTMSGNPRNEFLATVRSYTNFILRLEYKLIGTEGFVNSGVQFRSVRVKNPPNEMSGYQADIGAGFSGCLYDESRRNMVLVHANDETIKRLEKPGDWNRYEIQCEARHIQIRLNGVKTVDYSELDTTIPLSGLIGLQIHGGNKAEVSFRNIAIQEL